MFIKYFLIILLSSIFCGFAQGQVARPTPTITKPASDNERKTDLEIFQERLGAVIIKGFTRVGSISGLGDTLTITAYEFTDASTRTKVIGLNIEISDGERYSTSRSSFIEYKEIDGLLRGLDYVAKIDKSVTTLSNFEAQFKTKGNFSITVFNDSSNKLMVALKAGVIGEKSIFLALDKLAEFRDLIDKSKAILDSLPK